ncbi:MAG: DoxX family protein [Dehalococcoidia bacterium]
MKDLALLLLRLSVGGLMMGHGAQKLFGVFGGHGMQGTAGWLESIGLRPGHRWAMMAGGSEFGGGALTALGLASPLGPIGIIAAMSTATAKVHWGKPIWVSEGGAELPATNSAVASALAIAGPGRYSLDRALGLRLPPALVLLAATAAAAGVVMASSKSPPASDQTSAEQPPTEAEATTEEDMVEAQTAVSLTAAEAPV